MMRFAADENFDGSLFRALKEQIPTLDIVRVQDTEMYQSPDTELLEWLGAEERILLTHDVNTMPGFLYDRVRAGLGVPGIIEVKQGLSIGQALDELEVLLLAGTPQDFENQVRYVPM